MYDMMPNEGESFLCDVLPRARTGAGAFAQQHC